MMNSLKIKRLLIALVFMSTSTAALAAGKHALLIGIQDYRNTPFHSLKGAANDIELTKGVLEKRFGLSDDDFTILLDDKATHTGIENAFMSLIERVQAGDFVYIHYSGHGSQTVDLNGDERSGKDQTWVSFGARSSHEAHKDNYDVLDDEINAWLAALYAKTEQVVFVSDSCHSATVSRGVLTRAVEDDDRPHILGKLTYARPATERGIRVGAARDYESAIGKRREDGQYYGVFSWHWAHSLQQAQAGDTWNHIYKRTYAQVTAERGVVQQPQLAGESQAQVLGGGFIAQPPTISVTKIDDGWIKMPAGFLAGVTEGSVYRLYKPQHPNRQSLARLKITKVKAFASFGQPEPKGAFQTGDLVVEESHAYDFTPIRVSVEADFPNGKDKPLLQAIRAAFQPRSDGTQALPAYILADDPSHTDLRLHMLRPERKNGQPIRRAKANEPLPKSFADQPPELWVLTQEERLLNEKLQIHFDNLTRGVQLLQDNLNKLARVRELKALQSHRRRRMPVTLQGYVLTPVTFCQELSPNCQFVEGLDQYYRKTAGPYRLQEIQELTLAKEQILTFSLHNQSRRRDYYCYILNISSDGAISSIFPEPEDRSGYARVNAGETLELIEETGLITELVGEETLKFITSRYPIDVSLLEQEAFEQRGRSLTRLERLLFTHAVHGRRGRVSLRNDGWATGLAAFEVK